MSKPKRKKSVHVTGLGYCLRPKRSFFIVLSIYFSFPDLSTQAYYRTTPVVKTAKRYNPSTNYQ